jgi:hypothetical protein
MDIWAECFLVLGGVRFSRNGELEQFQALLLF